MTYRTIEVNNKVYEYTIGKTHTKIKNVGVFLNETIGEVQKNEQVSVKPSDLKAIIEKLT
jgi:hypothetical protein